MRNLLEIGVMSNMFGYITPSDILRLVTEINPILEAYDLAAEGNVYASNNIPLYIYTTSPLAIHLLTDI